MTQLDPHLAPPRLVDLDDLAGLERAWAELERVRSIRAVDPELREDILRRLDQIDPVTAAPVRAALDRMHPEMVLEAFFRTICPNRSTIGAPDA